jgi:hypothetical protein
MGEEGKGIGANVHTLLLLHAPLPVGRGRERSDG